MMRHGRPHAAFSAELGETNETSIESGFSPRSQRLGPAVHREGREWN